MFYEKYPYMPIKRNFGIIDHTQGSYFPQDTSDRPICTNDHYPKTLANRDISSPPFDMDLYYKHYPASYRPKEEDEPVYANFSAKRAENAHTYTSYV